MKTERIVGIARLVTKLPPSVFPVSVRDEHVSTTHQGASVKFVALKILGIGFECLGQSELLGLLWRCLAGGPILFATAPILNVIVNLFELPLLQFLFEEVAHLPGKTSSENRRFWVTHGARKMEMRGGHDCVKEATGGLPGQGGSSHPKSSERTRFENRVHVLNYF